MRKKAKRTAKEIRADIVTLTGMLPQLSGRKLRRTQTMLRKLREAYEAAVPGAQAMR